MNWMNQHGYNGNNVHVKLCTVIKNAQPLCWAAFSDQTLMIFIHVNEARFEWTLKISRKTTTKSPTPLLSRSRGRGIVVLTTRVHSSFVLWPPEHFEMFSCSRIVEWVSIVPTHMWIYIFVCGVCWKHAPKKKADRWVLSVDPSWIHLHTYRSWKT